MRVGRLIPNAKAGGVVHGSRSKTKAEGGGRILRILLEETEEGLTKSAEASEDATPTYTLRSPERIRTEGTLAGWSEEK